MKPVRLIRRAVSPVALHAVPAVLASRVETITTVRRWVQEHQRTSRDAPRATFAALFVLEDTADVGVSR